MQYINRNAELYQILEDKTLKGRPRKWKPILRAELHIYLAVLIHIGLHVESSIKEYWHKDFSYSSIHIVRNFIKLKRFQQINRYFYCTKLQEDNNEAFQNTFKRIWDLSKYLHVLCRKFYTLSIHLAVNETIEWFTSQVPEIINISTKPTPEGFKIWVLGN